MWIYCLTRARSDDQTTNFTSSFPLVTRRTDKIKKIRWITQGILISTRRKKELHKQAKETRNVRIKNYYKKYKNVYKKVVKKAKQNANSNYIKKSDNKSKASWTVVKNELGIKSKAKEKDEIRITKGNDKLEGSSAANALNEHFINIVATINTMASSDVALQKLKERPVNIIEQLDLEGITITEVKRVIANMKPKMSSGWDEIPMRILKEAKDIICYPLCKLINQSLKTGCFPENLKYGTVMPIHKGGEREISNYRPISLLPSFSKIFESVVKQRLIKYFIINNFFVTVSMALEKVCLQIQL